MTTDTVDPNKVGKTSIKAWAAFSDGKLVQSQFHSTSLAIFAEKEWGEKLKPQGSDLREVTISY